MSRLSELFFVQITQVTVVILLALLIDAILLRTRNHRFRHVLWVLVLLKMLTPPVISSPLGVFSLAQMSIVVPSDCGDTISRTWLARTNEVVASHPTLVAGVVVVWLCGALLLTLVWVLRLRRVASGYDTDDRELVTKCEQLVADISRELKIARVPKLKVTSMRFGPAVFGLVRPTVVVPEHLLSMLSEEQLRPILIHELVHIKRRDTWMGALQMLTALVWWFHPLAWIALRRLSGTLEFVTDDEVVEIAGVDQHVYANSLISVIEAGQAMPPTVGTVGVFACQVTDSRIRRLIQRQTTLPNRVLSWAVGLVVACVLLPGQGLVLDGSILIDTQQTNVVSTASSQ